MAAESGKVKMIRFLVQRGIPVDVKSSNGMTPLHEAAMNGRPQAVRMLLKLGARHTAKSSFGTTALQLLEGSSDRFQTEQQESAQRDAMYILRKAQVAPKR